MAYNVAEDERWFFLLRKWVNVNTICMFLDLQTRHLIKVRSEIIIAVLLKVQVFWYLTVYWVSSHYCVHVQPYSITFQKSWKFHLRIMLYHLGCCFLVFSTMQCCGSILTICTSVHPLFSRLKESDPSWCQSSKGCGLLQGMWLFTSMGMGQGTQCVLQHWGTVNGTVEKGMQLNVDQWELWNGTVEKEVEPNLAHW